MPLALASELQGEEEMDFLAAGQRGKEICSGEKMLNSCLCFRFYTRTGIEVKRWMKVKEAKDKRE